MFKSDALIESKLLRESVIDRTDALDRVKALAMLPDDLHVSVEMAGNYYEVSPKTIESVIFDHKEELESDGMEVLVGERLSLFKQECLKKAVSPTWRKTQSNVKAKRDLFLRVGVSKESAIAHALTHEELESGGDLTAFKREVRTDDTEKTLTPTELGKLLEKPMSAIKVNITLEKAGLRVKNLKGDWELADKGKPYAQLMPVAVHGCGVTVERYAIRWRQSVLEEVSPR